MSSTPIFRSRQQQLVEHQQGAPLRDVLMRLYVEEGLTQQQVAERLGVSRDAVVRWMAAESIPTRDRRALAPAEAVA